MTKKHGFTLAEVLITLGIIGVVAAMTIPTLIANTNSAKFRAQFKKTLSTLNQAALMGQAQYDMNYADATKVCGNDAGTESAEADATICGILNDVLSGAEYVANVGNLPVNKSGTETTYKASAGGNIATQISVTVPKEGGADGETETKTVAVDLSNFHGFRLADGSLFAFYKDSKICTKSNPCIALIDVNGTTLPNKEVTCDNGKPGDTAATTGENPQAATTCKLVPNDAAHMTDIYPVKFYDSTVEPATKAAKYVLTTSK